MLTIENLWKVFNKHTVNETTIFKGVNLTIEDGDFITIIGSNGAGKSTLLNIISQAIKEDYGSIILDGIEISNIPQYKASKYIGRVFQNPSLGVAPNMTILENLSMANNKGNKFNLTWGINKKDINFFCQLLKELDLGLEDKLNTKVGLLSGGQRQAVSLIMAVMKKPKLLLLDEHTAALDPKTSESIIKITERIVKENNMTTIMITHNLNHAVKLGNRLIMMHRGEIILDLKGEEKKALTTEKLLNYFETMKFKEELSDRVMFS
ncbi:ABC transporter ATP-binding protein [Clostridium tetanomorphum]|uniref:ATP-binding cassette domain-containing protein n=1 Tax=Clostridium tetanomorphum TaxID=1553 RepID=A0A923J251_CLOTT|nr:ATP-binding cassette domain-containing protein [Clostridium tetanomorphum]MBC2399474.1 ATP-binding cassette domain-containing protein [Clostridium tetanomorphum]NRZ97800.1 putative ABC transport system ATP-binding protein [Clostridium tetanomorphum]